MRTKATICNHYGRCRNKTRHHTGHCHLHRPATWLGQPCESDNGGGCCNHWECFAWKHELRNPLYWRVGA